MIEVFINFKEQSPKLSLLCKKEKMLIFYSLLLIVQFQAV